METVTVRLNRDDLGQIVDGLTQRMEAYDHTAAFLEDEDHNLDNFLIEEVTDSTEARALAANYKRIIDAITQQIADPTASRRKRKQESPKPDDADVSLLADEYQTLVAESRRTKDPDTARDRLLNLLITTANWQPQTAHALLDLAEQYGSFALRTALALSLALGIEDGSLGF